MPWNTINKYPKWKRYLIILISSGILSYGHRTLLMRLYRWYYKLPNGPLGLPYFGALPYIIYSMRSFYAILLPSYGPISSFTLGFGTCYVINDPIIASKLLENAVKREAYIRKDIHNYDKNTSFGLHDGKEWKLRKQLIQSKLFTIMNSKFLSNGIGNLMKTIIFPHINQHIINNTFIEWETLLKLITFNITLCASIGENITDLNDKFSSKYIAATDEFLQLIPTKTFVSLFLTDYVVSFLPPKYLTPEIKHIALFAEHISQNKSKILKNNDSCYTVIMNDMNKYSDDMNYTERKLICDLATINAAGLDTTARMLTVLIYGLCKYTDIQEKIYNELICVFNNKNELVLINNKVLIQLNIFRAYVSELMRLYPIQYFTLAPRMIDENMIVSDDKSNKEYYIPKNSIIWTNIIAICHNKKYWNNNNKNDDLCLDNWLDNNGKYVQNKSFPVFGFGKRKCPGNHLAFRIIYYTLAQLILNYQFKNNNIIVEPVGDVTLKVIHQNITIKKRN